MRRTHRDLAGLDTAPLASLHAALTADGTEDERSGAAAALAAYRAVSWTRRRRLRRPAVLATRLGVATAVASLGLTGVATAAYTGSLPDALQDVAHKAIKAPKAHPPAQAVGPDARGEAAYGLCQAFAKDDKDKDDEDKDGKGKDDKGKDDEDARDEGPKATATHEPQGRGKGLDKDRDAQGKDRGQAKEKSVAYRNLVRAAGGEDKVDAYCASVPKPSGKPESSARPDKAKPSARASHDSGAATPRPSRSQAPTGSPSPSPSPSPTGSVSDLPSP